MFEKIKENVMPPLHWLLEVTTVNNVFLLTISETDDSVESINTSSVQ